MIRNQWYVLLDSNQVAARPIGVTRMGERLVFWRDGSGKVNCAFDRCPHRGAALSIGKVINNHLRCPFHGFEFDASGQCRHIPADGRHSTPPKAMRLSTYPTHEEHGFIWVWWGGDPPAGLQPPQFFDNLDDPSFHYGASIDHWQAHYSRVVENQLDVAHLPFVHHNTIGRGNRTLVDGPLVKWSDKDQGIMYTYVFNRSDDGTPPRSPAELDADHSDVHLEFIMPNLWQNYISERVRVLAAFVPVDDENTLLYLRFYQKFMPIPILGKWVAQLAMPSNRYIAGQDRVVVTTQEPKISSMQPGIEKPIKADVPIIEYRRMREKLQKSNHS
jgi:phenylpropionate dioxygenase-like ring-hydroxylating dioxygenase large terminal subunit